MKVLVTQGDSVVGTAVTTEEKAMQHMQLTGTPAKRHYMESKFWEKLASYAAHSEEQVFQGTFHEKYSLNGWCVSIWEGAVGEPSCAEECLDLFQNIILLCREESLTADSLGL